MRKTTTLSVKPGGNISETVREIVHDDQDLRDYPTEGPDVAILAASLKGAFCNYKFELIQGSNEGDILDQKGSNVVHEDLIRAFKRLHVHLAVACEEIDKDDIKDIDAIPEWDTEAETPKRLTPLQEMSRKVFHFSCSSYKSDGTGENEGVTLVGQKRLTTGDYVKLESPKILTDGDYQFINELRVVIDDINHQVKLYRNGKFAPKFEQGSLEFPGEADNLDGKEED